MMRQHTRLIGWVVAVLVILAFCQLGRWQLQRMHEKQALLDQQLPARAQTLSLAQAQAAPVQLRWVEDHGHFLPGTVLLGAFFLTLQAEEYIHAYKELNLTLGSGIYGSTFFMLTGFHGAHVLLGTIMLMVMWLRAAKGHFTRDNHFGFEAAAWYWHFVDVVWLMLFLFVYVL